jgi:hypothetical protein
MLPVGAKWLFKTVLQCISHLRKFLLAISMLFGLSKFIGFQHLKLEETRNWDYLPEFKIPTKKVPKKPLKML